MDLAHDKIALAVDLEDSSHVRFVVLLGARDTQIDTCASD